MKSKMKTSLSLAALSLAVIGLSGTAQAQSGIDNTGFYVGAGYGQYSFQFEDRENDIDFDDDAGVLKGYIGAQFSPYLGVELAYLNFDELNDNDNYSEVDGYSLAGRLSLPLSERFSLYAKGGWFEWEAQVSANTPAFIDISSTQEGGDVFYGVGMQYAFTQNIQTRLEYERFELEDDIEPDMDVASLSIQYMF